MTTDAPTVARPRDFLRISDLEPEELTHLLDLAARMKAKPRKFRKARRAEALACYFAKPSTRTRVSFEAAAHRLGMLPIMLRPDELQLGRGEPVADTARVLSSYCEAIVIRTFAQREVEEVAEAASVPVINALTDEHHPCQALADLLTLRERFGQLEGLTLAYVGDGNNVAHSLMEAGALAGMRVVVGCPAGYEPDAEIERRSHEVAATMGGGVHVMHDPRAVVSGAHAVYTDVWVSMGEEQWRERRLAELGEYKVTSELMALARPEAVFMHCLPAHRALEVAAEVIDGPQSIVFPQAANRLPTEQAVIQTLISGEWELS